MPRVRTTKYGKSTFVYEAAGVWNSLPNELQKVEDIREFRRLVDTALCANVQCAKVDQFLLSGFAYVLFQFEIVS